MTDARDLPVIVPHVADILKASREFTPRDGKEFKYAFEIALNQKELAGRLMIAMQLPDTVSWYQLDGQRLFEVRGPHGTVSAICYLVTY
jgi:hypothetical protein